MGGGGEQKKWGNVQSVDSTLFWLYPREKVVVKKMSAEE